MNRQMTSHCLCPRISWEDIYWISQEINYWISLGLNNRSLIRVHYKNYLGLVIQITEGHSVESKYEPIRNPKKFHHNCYRSSYKLPVLLGSVICFWWLINWFDIDFQKKNILFYFNLTIVYRLYIIHVIYLNENIIEYDLNCKVFENSSNN